jgi:chromate reductase
VAPRKVAMPELIRILGICGSLREGSFNRKLLHVAQEVLPPDVRWETVDLHGIPPFNQDEENAPPEAVQDLKAKVRAADAILFATPEYNYSAPGVLKNAIDWVSRPYGQSAWEGKPVAVVSASTGMLGGARAQYHLRQSFVFLNMFPINRPEVIVTFAERKFDARGNLTDPETGRLLGELLKNLAEWSRKLQRPARGEETRRPMVVAAR